MLPKKSFWRDRTLRIWSFYCPLCGVPRRISYQPRPGLKHLFQIALTSSTFMLATWKWFEWRGWVVFLPLWAVFEVIYRSRVRAAVACGQCGFDPYLYLNDLPRAREVVENHWRKKFAERGIPFPEKNGAAATFASPTAASNAQPQIKTETTEMVT